MNTSRKKSRAASLRIDLPSSGSSIEDGLVDVVVVYKIDRLSRSLMDFSKLVEVFDRNNVTFVSVTGYAGEHQRLNDQKTWDHVQSILQQSPRLRASNKGLAQMVAEAGVIAGKGRKAA